MREQVFQHGRSGHMPEPFRIGEYGISGCVPPHLIVVAEIAAAAGTVRIAPVPVGVVGVHVAAGETNCLACRRGCALGERCAGAGRRSAVRRRCVLGERCAGVGRCSAAGRRRAVRTGCAAELYARWTGVEQDDAPIAALSNSDPDMPARTHDVSGTIIGYLPARNEGAPAAGGEIS